ncbi:TPT-domain-containing protein [Sistotremastrum niveocremeum HHB9708]|uniref:TPT-domain-containing protein n=1 Tax=Sistotremastrum niveocremeum HHB9708 TaxID=1314777 RepID=A0A164VYD3_9AGAM|nr:TPT-domain-containing protein [Sistotremastrum niveocremeum HHB9708]
MPSIATVRFVLLCCLWYMSSALSSNTGKQILNQFRLPVTLTIVQFGFVAGYCVLFASPVIPYTKIRSPTRSILRSTFPMGIFQVGGHVFSSVAMSRIPVSTVHTIKALSPLFTVATYACLFGVSYSMKTYTSLIPLTLGVMLACSFDVSGSNALGLLCAFGSALVFVSSNIFFKKIMPSHTSSARETSAHKLDKINLLFYSSGMAFLLMIPLWMYYDLAAIASLWSTSSSRPGSSHSLVFYFLMNGTTHFAQNILAFTILSSTSPVTYSIASLVKRVAVIIIAIIWFSQAVHPVQGLGIGLTFVGLWMYNAAKDDVQKGENKLRRVEATRDLLLPVSREEHRMMVSSRSSSPNIEPISFTYPSYSEKAPIPIHPVSLPPIDPSLTKLRVPPAPTFTYPSPPHSPPTTAQVFHPSNVQHRRGTISSSVDIQPHPQSQLLQADATKTISVL